MSGEGVGRVPDVYDAFSAISCCCKERVLKFLLFVVYPVNVVRCKLEVEDSRVVGVETSFSLDSLYGWVGQFFQSLFRQDSSLF